MVSVSGTVPQVSSNNGGVTKVPPPTNCGTALAPIDGLHHMGDDVLASNYAFKTKSVCEHYKNYVPDPELYSLIYELQKAWNLN